eukprot:2844092-Rhodomonas_salina.1
MEGIELEAEGCGAWDSIMMESGLSAFEVLKFKARWCTHGDGESGHGLYCRAQEYDDDLDFKFRLGIHYARCMEWMHNAEFGEFHVFQVPPWERDIVGSGRLGHA